VADARIAFSMEKNVGDKRTLELINKTNQFNLNGERIGESQWARILEDPSTFVLTATYNDKYGPLGKIAVMTGKNSGATLNLTSWVMSCRAFSRRIEHQCLKFLFEKFRPDSITLQFVATPRNGPLQEFLTTLLGSSPSPGCVLYKVDFEERVGPLFHSVLEEANA